MLFYMALLHDRLSVIAYFSAVLCVVVRHLTLTAETRNR